MLDAAPHPAPHLRLGALSRLRAQLDLLTPALRRVAAHALAHPFEVIYQTVTELAEASGSGEASVIRLTRDLGFLGFQDFKLALAADLAHEPTPEGTAETPADLILQAVRRTQTAIAETHKVLEADALGAVLDLLAGARAVLVCGQGASGVTAQDYAFKLLRLGVPVWAPGDAHLAAMQAATLPAGSVALGISRSGSTTDTVHCLRQAKLAGARTVAITHRAKSPITRHADLTLYTASPEDPLGGGAVATTVGQLLVLEALYRGLTLRLPHASESLRLTAAAVTEKSY